MAYRGEQEVITLTVGSLIGAHLPVFLPIASSRDRVAVPVASGNEDVIGLTIATGASVGNTVGVAVAGYAKAVAAASLGAGCRVGVASTNGALGPVGASGLAAHVASAGAVEPKFQVGRALEAAAAGAIFTVLVDPQQIL
ncbi:MAG: hypothetical protein KJ058_00465 [Thermoanaerobaculia bacterium]|nr:hypothetical protein [Thermoanaerobaculia bacterium]